MDVAEPKTKSLSVWTVALIAAALLAFVVFAHVRSPVSTSSLGDSFQNSLHGPGFAAVAILILAFLRIYHPGPHNYRNAALLALGIGVLSEAAQIPFPRDASLGDLIADILGVIAGIGFIAVLDKTVRQKLKRWKVIGLSLVTFAAFSMTFMPSAFYAYAAVSQWQAMPNILTFENAWERAVYRQNWKNRPKLLPAPTTWPTQYDTSALAEETGRFRMLISVKPVFDWTNYDSLSFAASSANEDQVLVQLVIRQRSVKYSRSRVIFRKSIAIDSAYQRISIPLQEIANNADGGPMDMSRVSSIALLAIDEKPNVSVWLDDFRLDR